MGGLEQQKIIVLGFWRPSVLRTMRKKFVPSLTPSVQRFDYDLWCSLVLLHHSDLCLQLHMVFSPCIPASASPPFYKDTSSTGLGAYSTTVWPHPHLNTSVMTLVSNFEVLGFRTSPYKFWSNTNQLITCKYIIYILYSSCNEKTSN